MAKHNAEAFTGLLCTMKNVPAKYSKQERATLTAIRDDIMQRPADYQEGATYLKREFGPEARHGYALADWEKWKDEPAQKGAWEAVADRLSADIADNAKRRPYRGEVLRELSAPPRPADWPLSKCFCTATEALFTASGNGCDHATAQAVLLLAVMLWDWEAEKSHELFALFGNWDERWMAATEYVYEDVGPQAWMDNVDGALDILPRVGPRVRKAIAPAVVTADAAQAGVKAEPLSDTEQVAFDIISEHPDGKAISAKDLLREMQKRRVTITEGHLFRCIIPHLKACRGVKNRRCVGYYLPR